MADTIKSIQLANGNTYTLDADLLDSHESSYFVDTATNQTISGGKIFSGYVQLANNFSSNCWYQNKKSDDQTASLSYISQEGGNISIDTDYENKGYLDLSATRIDSDITPSTDATYNLGGSTIYCISNLYPSSTGTMSLGASTNKWASSYVTSSYTNYLYPITSGSSIKSYAGILPGNTNSYSLGSLSYKWYEVYAGNMFAMYNTNNYIKLYADSSYSYLNNVREGSSYKLTLPTKAGAIPVVTDATGVSFSAIDDKEYNLIDVPDKYDSSISIGYRSSSSSQPTSLDFTSTTTLYYSRVSFPCITPGCGLIIIRVLCFSRSDDTWYRIPYKTLTGLNTKNYTINLISINVMDYKTTLANQAAQWVVHYGTEGNDPNYVYVGCDYPNASSGWYGTLILFYTS